MSTPDYFSASFNLLNISFVFLCFKKILILLSGEVEQNPGPKERNFKEIAMSVDSISGSPSKSNLPSDMISTAINIAANHGFSVHRGVINLANGDCALEVIIDSLSTQNWFGEIGNFTEDPVYYRKLWFDWIKANRILTVWGQEYTDVEWEDGWEQMKKPGMYENRFGDYVMPAIAHLVKKDILVIDTRQERTIPIYPILAMTFCGQPPTTEIPIIVAYNGYHYESLVPNAEKDRRKVIEIKKAYIQGSIMLSENQGSNLQGFKFKKTENLEPSFRNGYQEKSRTINLKEQIEFTYVSNDISVCEPNKSILCTISTKESDTVDSNLCTGCGKYFIRLISHLNKNPICKKQYNMDEVIMKLKEKSKERKKMNKENLRKKNNCKQKYG